MLGILNHDLRSPVNSFIHFIEFQKNNPEMLDTTTKERIENTTIASAKNLLNTMEDILLWTKDQMQNFAPQLKIIAVESVFDDIQKHFVNQENVAITFDNRNKIYIYTDENYLKTIFRNLTENAIKVLVDTENPTIHWKAWQENNQTFISITDNGPGAEHSQFRALYDDSEVIGIKSGLGLHVIRDLAKAINAQIEVQSIVGHGTTISILI